MRRFRFRHSPALAVLVTALVVTLGGAAYATIPDSAGVIHGCYKIGGEGFDSQRGSLRVIDTDSGQSCRKHETALTWNQTGPQGPAGPQGNTGAQGPEGPQGVQGAPGLSGYVVSTNSAVVGGLSTIHGAAYCPAGTVPLGGGINVSDYGTNGNGYNAQNNIHTIESFPSGTQWFVGIVNNNSAPITAVWYATCAKTS